MSLRRALPIVIALTLTLPAFAQQASEAKAPAAPDTPLQPFVARYRVTYYGVNAGVIQVTLRAGDQPNEYRYESRAEPSFLGSFMIGESARETSTMAVDAGGVRPLRFVSDDGKSGDEKDSDLRFDWSQNRMFGRSERKEFNQPPPERVQDHMSIQIAVIRALQTGSEQLGEFSLVDAGAIKQYTYGIDGVTTVRYQGKLLQATVVSSKRTGSKRGRVNRYWHAADMGQLPVRMERSRDGKTDLAMELLQVQFTP
jgi:hypothetical protein